MLIGEVERVKLKQLLIKRTPGPGRVKDLLQTLKEQIIFMPYKLFQNIGKKEERWGEANQSFSEASKTINTT